MSDSSNPKRSGKPPTAKSQPTTSPLSDVHRSLPHAEEAEQGVLGSMLISPTDVIGEAVELIDEHHFYTPAHNTIYKILVEFWNKQSPVDTITLTQVLRDRNLLDSVGGAAFITHLLTFTPTAANATHYMEIVRKKYLLRQVIVVGTGAVSEAYDDPEDVEPLMDDFESKVLGINEARQTSSIVPIKEQVISAIETIQMLYERRGAITGLGTGITEFDRMTNGLQNSDMIVIAARPSMGKTAFAMRIVEHVALELNKAVAVFSLEMSSQQLVTRMVCSLARVNLQKIRDGFLTERDFPALTATAAKLAETKILIDDTSGLSILELRAKARRLKQMHDVSLIVIDYLQLLKSTSKKAQDNRQVEVSEISSGVKGLAKELKIPILVLAQLNRNPEQRAGGKPRLSDLRESGSVEQDADLVGLLVRAKYYAEDEEAKEEVEGEAELIIAKQRNGPVGEVKLTFLEQFARFENRAEIKN